MQLAALLVDQEQGSELNTVVELEMSADTDHITQDESETLATESLDARALDQQLATELRRGRLGGSTSSGVQLRELGARPRLPVGTERRLVQAAREGDRRAREELVEAFLPLIAGVARVYRGSPSITRVELIQEGVVGLLRALERYDPALGVPFWGYATWWVRQAMQQLIAELTRPLVLSDRALRQLSRLKRAHGDYLAEHGREPSGNELAVSTGLTHAQVGEMLALERVPLPQLPQLAGPVGMALQASGLALRTWSMRTLGASYTRTLRTDDQQHVVDTGPYRFVRHPGYAGSLLTWAGFGLTSRSVPVVLLVAALLGRAYRQRIVAEENLLERELPGYAEYIHRTKRIVPFVW